MRNRVLILIIAVAVCSITAFSQAPAGQRQRGMANAAAAAPDTTPFDPHDLSGIWLRLAPRGGDRSISAKAPPLTPAGKARMAKNLPARSRTEKPAPDDPADSNDQAFRDRKSKP